MMDRKYLQQRGNSWFFTIAIPRDLRAKFGGRDKVVKALGTADINKARRERWALVEEWTDAFERARGKLALSRDDINKLAMQVYHDELVALDRQRVSIVPPDSELKGWARDGITDPEVAAQAEACQIILERYATDFDEEGEPAIPEVLDDEFIAADIEAARKRTGLAIEPSSQAYKLVAKAFSKAKVDALEGRMLALRGIPSNAPAAFLLPRVNPVTLQTEAISRPRAKSVVGEAFSAVASRYLTELQRDAGAKLTEQTIGQARAVFRLFKDFTSDAPLASIDRAVAADFLTTVSQLHPHWGRAKAAQDMPLDELLKKFGHGKEQLSNTTLNRYASALSGLFKWARQRGQFDGQNPFAEQNRKKGSAGWLPFTIEELNKLFGPSLPTDPAMHWIPAIGLYSGMRLGEVCQLRTDDVKRERKVWYFNVSEGENGQRVKTEASVRRVPVHSQLIKRGFLDYLKTLPSGQQLFPQLKAGGPDGKLSWYFGKRFTAYRRSVGINRPRVAFHSFRKNATTALDNAGVKSTDIAAVLGHERGFTLDTYSKGLELPALQAIVEKIKYPGLRFISFDDHVSCRRSVVR
jgi:integrase